MKTEKRLPTYKAGGQTQPALSRATAVIDTLSHFHSGALGRPRLNNNFPSWHPSEKLKKKRSLFLSLFLSICQAQSISRGPWGSLPRRSQPQAVHARPFGADFRDRLLLYPGTQFSRHIQVLGLLPGWGFGETSYWSFFFPLCPELKNWIPDSVVGQAERKRMLWAAGHPNSSFNLTSSTTSNHTSFQLHPCAHRGPLQALFCLEPMAFYIFLAASGIISPASGISTYSIGHLSHNRIM